MATVVLLCLLVAFVPGGRGWPSAVPGPPGARLERLLAGEQSRLTELAQRMRGVEADLDRLERPGRSRREELEGRLAASRRAMGLVPAVGTGLAVVLEDSPDASASAADPNQLVVHSEDVQAVANGLWAAGARAVSVNGQRIVATSTLLCVGNTLLVNGTVHSPPFRFLAVGGPPTLEARFLADPLVERVRRAAQRYHLRFAVERTGETSVPAYDAVPLRRYAQGERQSG